MLSENTVCAQKLESSVRHFSLATLNTYVYCISKSWMAKQGEARGQHQWAVRSWT